MQVTVQAPGPRTILLDDDVLDGGALARVAADVDASAPLPRRCYAAAHVVMVDAYRDVPHDLEQRGTAQEIATAIDWDTTMAHRTRLDACGMGIAEAMDTAQRFDLGWSVARTLIERTGALGLANGFVGAASTDHLEHIASVDDLSAGLVEQVAIVRANGGVPILLPQPWMTTNGATEGDYVRLYCDVVDASEGELLLHWLGADFHPAMRGYFPGDSVHRILAHDPEKVRGIKISLLDREFEETLRGEIAGRGQVVFTGDDHNFSALIEGTSQASIALPPMGGQPLAGGAFSHALLGIFDTIARPASRALRLLEVGDLDGYRTIMGPCEALGRAIFEAPVQRYKSGIAFLAWLNGHQANPMLANHEERQRSLDHYLRVAELASAAGVIEDARLAGERLSVLIDARNRNGAAGS